MRMAEIEQLYRHDADNKMLDQDEKSISRGQWLGSITAAISILAASYTAYIGAHWSVSCALVGVPMLGAITAIVNRK